LAAAVLPFTVIEIFATGTFLPIQLGLASLTPFWGGFQS
jgi:hypothetical protein